MHNEYRVQYVKMSAAVVCRLKLLGKPYKIARFGTLAVFSLLATCFRVFLFEFVVKKLTKSVSRDFCRDRVTKLQNFANL